MRSFLDVVIFGGSGFLGRALIKYFVTNGLVEKQSGLRIRILVVARNERALVALKEEFPDISIMVGDISDPWVVKRAMALADMAFILSAMKHVGLAEVDVKSCIETNITGTKNIINESLESKPGHVIFISSDKAAQPNGVYGCTKKIGESLMVEAEKINPDTQYRVIRYGNVWASSGSIATKWKPKMEKGEEVIITDRRASRFFWTVEEAVAVIFECITKATSAQPYIPAMKAVSMGTVLDACLEAWGNSPVKEIGLQPGENLVETTDGKTFSDTCEQFSKEEFKEKFLGVSISVDEREKRLLDRLDKMPEPAHPRITAVLITKADKYPKIIEERLDTGFFDEIIIVPRCESVYHRYLAAEQASNEIIYVQDDDCMVNYQELFKHYNSQITNAMPKDFIEKYKDTGCTLVGWGCYFPKAMLASFSKYLTRYNIDKHLLREADRIFTALNQPFNTVIMPHEDLPQTGDRMGYQPDHYTSMAEALEKVKAIL